MSTLIEANNLYRYYDSHCAVNDLSFKLNKGEILGFLGPNGAGKTTTMQMLCGNLAPSAGQVLISGLDLLDQPKAAKSQLGYLPDTPPLYKDFTVDEFLSFCARLHGLSFRQIYPAISKAKRRCDLEQVSRRLIAHLSKGFQQRIGIAQAIIHEPELIILDEPTVGLDPIQIREIRSLITELGQEHGIILSTHILSEVQESCTHVQIIHQGQLILHQTVNDLNRRMNSATLKIRTRQPIAPTLFQQITGFISIEKLPNGYCLLHHAPASNIAEAVARIIIESGCGLEEIAPVRQSMEDIFIALTQQAQ
jgi:gliding motility-associated transport system ATP-binding protein